MLEGRLLPRAFWMGVSAATVSLSGSPLPARDRQPAQACLTAYHSAQERQRSGHLREGRDLLLECSKASCAGLQKKCASAAGQLDADIALITPVVTDDKGAALLDVQVKVDGEPLTTRLDGRPLAVDPGVHRFSFSARVGPWPGREIATTKTITIEQGQRGAIAVSLPPLGAEETASAGALATTADHPDRETEVSSGKEPGPASPERDAAPVARHGGGPSAFTYVLGGFGLLGVGAGGLLTYWGKTDNDALGACTPNCHPSAVNHIRQLYLGADISFAAGGAALGLAALLFATAHFDVQPVHSGALASFKGVF